MAEINHIQEDCLQVALVSEVLLLFYLPGSCEPIETIIKSSARTHSSHGHVQEDPNPSGFSDGNRKEG